MKMMHYLYALLFLACSVMAPLQASATIITLEDALEMAKQNNINLQSTSIDLQGAKRDVDTSWNLFLPMVNATISNGGGLVVFQDNPAIKTNTNINNGLSAGLSLQFQLNPAVKNQLASYDVNYSIQQVTYRQAQIELERNVTKLFYYLIAEKTNLALQEQNRILAEKQYGKVAANYEGGYASEMELLSSELSVQQLKPSFQQTKNSYDSQMLAFKVLLGLPLDTEVELEGTLPDFQLTTTVESLRNEIDGTIAMDLLRLNSQSLKNSMELQRKTSLMPSLTLSAQYGINLWNTRTSDLMNENFSDTAQYSVSVSIPLDGHIPGSRTQVSLAKIADSLEKLELNRQQTRVQMEQSVISQVNTIKHIQEQIKLARANRDLAQRVYDMYALQYEAGYTDYLSVEDAQQDVFSADQQIVFLHYQYASALVDLAYDLQIDIEQL